MRQILLLCCSLFLICSSYAQDISVRVRQVSFDTQDPDGAGPATGSVTFKFELKSSAGEVLADGMGLSVVYQSDKLMATPTNTVLKMGPINNAMWTHQVDNRIGNPITPVTYGGKSFDKRMIITFNQNVGVPDAVIPDSWTEVAQLTYYTLGTGSPRGGFIVPEPGVIVAQNELSSDGGMTTFPFLSPELQTPLAVGASGSPLPVHFVRVDAQCSSNGTHITWSTAYEKDNSHFEVEKSSDGNAWVSIGRVNSNSRKAYQFTDTDPGQAVYRIKQVDMDGSVSYSTLVRTTCSSTTFSVKLYPVPARDKVTLVIGSEQAIKTTAYVVDNNGRVVMSVPLNLSKGINNLPLDVSHLAQGQYFIRGAKDGLEINQRFTIAR